MPRTGRGIREPMGPDLVRPEAFLRRLRSASCGASPGEGRQGFGEYGITCCWASGAVLVVVSTFVIASRATGGDVYPAFAAMDDFEPVSVIAGVSLGHV